MKQLDSDAKSLQEANRAAGVVVGGWQPVNKSSNAPAATAEHRQLMVNTLTHASDLSNLCTVRSAAEKWNLRVNREFMAQQQKEALLGIPSPAHTLNLDKPEVILAHLYLLQAVLLTGCLVHISR